MPTKRRKSAWSSDVTVVKKKHVLRGNVATNISHSSDVEVVQNPPDINRSSTKDVMPKFDTIAKRSVYIDCLSRVHAAVPNQICDQKRPHFSEKGRRGFITFSAFRLAVPRRSRKGSCCPPRLIVVVFLIVLVTLKSIVPV